MKKILLIVGILSLLAAIGVAAIIIYMGLSTPTNNHSQRYSFTNRLITQCGAAICAHLHAAHRASARHGRSGINENLVQNIPNKALFSRPQRQARPDNFPPAAARRAFGRHRTPPFVMQCRQQPEFFTGLKDRHRRLQA